MIAAIVRGGRSSSFKGALDYVLRLDPERVGETGTANLFSAPGQAHTEMQTTADAARAVQARARAERGERTGASGSQTKNPVFHYALSWHPDDVDITPDRMFKAAHQTLDRLGLSQHQAVIVEHPERLHKHVHIIASVVHPETGRTNSLYRNAYILDRWCHEQEQAMGFRAFKRAAKYEPQPEKKPDAKPDWKAWKDRQKELWQARLKDEAALKAKQEEKRERHEERVNDVRRSAEVDKANARNRHRREIAKFWRKQAPKMTVQPRPSQSFLHGMETNGGEMGRALKGIVRPRYYAMPQQPEKPRAPVHSTFKRALSNTSPLQAPSPEQVRSAIDTQFRERSEPSKGNMIRHAGITDRFQGEQAIKRWQRGDMEEIDKRMREAVEKLRDDRDEEREQDQRDQDELKAKYERLRDEARREMSIPEPKVREPEPVQEKRNQEQQRKNETSQPEKQAHKPSTERAKSEPEPEIETDRYGNEIIDMNGSVEPEPSRDEPPPLEPDSYVPDRQPPPPEHDFDFEMGD